MMKKTTKGATTKNKAGSTAKSTKPKAAKKTPSAKAVKAATSAKTEKLATAMKSVLSKVEIQDIPKLTLRESPYPSYKLLGPRYFPNLADNLQKLGLEKKKGETSPIICFDCGQISYVSENLKTSNCRHCGVEMSMKDFVIDQEFRGSAIRTQGVVHVVPGTRLTGSSIMCRKMIMDGWLSGQIFCWGELLLNSSGTFEYTVQAHTVNVARGTEISLQRALRAKYVFVEGKVSGHIICDGTVELAEGALLMGDVIAGKLIVPSRAKHKGKYREISPIAANTYYSGFYTP